MINKSGAFNPCAFIGLVAIIAFGFVFTGCSDGNEETSAPPEVAVIGVMLSETEIELEEGDTGVLTATVAPNDASNKRVSWSSSNPTKATVSVNATTGVATVTAVAAGTATITVTTQNGNKTATCEVTVTAANPNAVHVTGVTLAPGTLSLTVGGASKTLTATVAPNNASNKRVSWSSSDNTKATVTGDPNTGVATVTAVAAGSATITVTTTDGSKTATCAVSVTLDEGMPEIPGMVWIKPGTFWMGSPTSEWGRMDDETRHQVTLTKGFYMGESPVMTGDYFRLTGENPTWHLIDYDEYGDYEDYFPVDGVNWYAAVEYCNLLSDDEGLSKVYTITNTVKDDGYTISATVSCNWSADGYRLPTEAEWEYACRAGTTSAYSTGDTITLNDANFYSDDGYNLEQPIPVIFYKPNAWGLYGMHGTLEEWCWDRYGSYGSGAQTDPKGSNSGAKRVVRGGSWFDEPEYVRSAARWMYDPADQYYDYYGSPYVGFRVVRNAPSGSSPNE